MKRDFPRQLCVEIPNDVKDWSMPWFPKQIKGFVNIGEDTLDINGEWVNSEETIEVGDYVMTLEGDLHGKGVDTYFDSEGNPLAEQKIRDDVQYRIFEEVLEFSDCEGLDAVDMIMVVRPIKVTIDKK